MPHIRWARVFLFLVVAALPFASAPAWAQEAELNGANTAWILTSTALVLFMTLPGLARAATTTDGWRK